MHARRLLCLSMMLVGIGCTDPGINVERSIFGPNGEKWCTSVKGWKFVQIDPLNCGDCDQPCPENHSCFKSKCTASEFDDGTNQNQGPTDCEEYLECLTYGCAAYCQSAADCQEIEQACADEQDTTLEELRDNGYVPLQCNTTTGRCFVETPDPPVDDDDDEDPPVDPPSPNTSNTCCGTGCDDCTESGRVCAGSGSSYSCECNGCEDNGHCFAVGHTRSFPDKPGYQCGASCKCLQSEVWGECSPIANCPI